MHLSSALSLAVTATAFATATVLPTTARATKPPAFFLAGDSTTATHGGWGDGFLELLKNGATAENHGKSGASTYSFMHTGYWDDVLEAAVASNETYVPYVTIQFGHNDQKALTMEEFKTNLAQMVDDANVANVIPILVTSLTRRDWDDDTDSVVENLKDPVEATKEVAEDKKVRLVELNAVSMKYINAIGHDNADEYNLSASDETHLNTSGETLFGNLMAHLIATSDSYDLGKDISDYLDPDSEIIAAIEDGTFILP
ncbi:hypothetical protein V494_03140 [Pseudogymnoascus sp. VKM F-4513 (FW-928)]|nr:hypothetical protein V494_03140 [Pseudogymnoascus sp. VKM F-4513 (FW-928)]